MKSSTVRMIILSSVLIVATGCGKKTRNGMPSGSLTESPTTSNSGNIPAQPTVLKVDTNTTTSPIIGAGVEGDLNEAIIQLYEGTPVTYLEVEDSSEILIVIGEKALEGSECEQQELLSQVIETISFNLAEDEELLSDLVVKLIANDEGLENFSTEEDTDVVQTEVTEVSFSADEEIVVNNNEIVQFEVGQNATIVKVVDYLSQNPDPALQEVLDTNLLSLKSKLARRIAQNERKLAFFHKINKDPAHGKIILKINEELRILKALLNEVEGWLK